MFVCFFFFLTNLLCKEIPINCYFLLFKFFFVFFSPLWTGENLFRYLQAICFVCASNVINSIVDNFRETC